MVYHMGYRAWPGMWYGLEGMAGYMVWPGRYAVLYGMAWQAWHCLWYGLAGMAWYLVWPGRAWHGIWYFLGRHGMIYAMAGGHGMVWPGGYGMVCGMAWLA